MLSDSAIVERRPLFSKYRSDNSDEGCPGVYDWTCLQIFGRGRSCNGRKSSLQDATPILDRVAQGRGDEITPVSKYLAGHSELDFGWFRHGRYFLHLRCRKILRADRTIYRPR